jgi:spore coat protein CotH
MKTRPGKIALLLVTLTAATSPAQDRAAKAKPATTPFEQTRVWAVQLTVPAREFEAMQPVNRGLFSIFSPPTPKAADGSARKVKHNNFGADLAWAKGDVVIDDAKFTGVGIRYKGNGTIGDAVNTIKKSIKIDLGQFGGTGRFHGVKTINLHCEVTDPSKCREALAYALYRSAGVPAPRTALAEVFLTVPDKYDRERLGLYTVVEQIDKAFLRDRFGTDEGLLMKPEGLREVADLGDDWEKYKKVYVPNREATPAESKRMIAFARLVSKGDDAAFSGEIGSYVDVDNYLRFLAVTAFIVNPDNLLNLGHNAYLYLHPKTGKLHVIPWDLDRAFANFFLFGTTRQQMNLSMTHPYPGTHKLTERLLAAPGIGDRYKALLAELAATSYAKDRLLADVGRLAGATREMIAQDAKAAEARKEVGLGAAATPTIVPPPDLKTFVEQRTAGLAAQLAGAPGHVPSQSIKLGELLAEPTLAMLDADKDGWLSKAEWLAAASAVFADCKKDDAGRTDEQGLAAALNKRYAPAARAKPAPGQPGGFLPGNVLAPAIMKLADADGDKKLSSEELLAAMEKLFDKFDHAKAGHLGEQSFGELLNTLFPNLGGPPAPPKKSEEKP